MLLSFRDNVKNSKWLKYTIIGVISVPFVLFGIGSYFSGGGDIFAAKVNGKDVSLQSYEQLYNQQRNRLRQAFGGKIPEAFSGDFLRQQALETAITQEVLLQHADDSNYAVGDKGLATAIAGYPAFQIDGRFDKALYERQLQSMGMTAPQFEASFRRDVAVDQLRVGVSATAFVLQTETSARIRLQDQEREFSNLTIALTPIKEGISISDDEAQAYFEQNASSYQQPEMVRVEYIELDVDKLAGAVAVTDADLEAFYESQKSVYVVPEERSASHILLAIDPDAPEDAVAEKDLLAQDIKRRLAEGEDFAVLAKAYSEDPGSAESGGDLGSFSRGVMVSEFDDAVFSLGEGEVSDPIRTEFGLHIIRVDHITPARGKSLAEAREQLESEFRRKEAESLFYDRAEMLGNAAYENSGSLLPAAEAVGVDILTSDWMASDSRDGIARFDKVRAAAFSNDVLAENLNSEVIEVEPSHVIVLRLKEHQPAKPKTLEEVRDEVFSAVQDQKASELAAAKADQILAALNSGSDAASLADGEAITFTPARWVGRQAQGESPRLLNKLFSLAKPVDGKLTNATLELGNGDRAVIQLSDVRDQDGEAPPAEVLASESGRLGNVEYSALVASLKARADVMRNNRLLEEMEQQR